MESVFGRYRNLVILVAALFCQIIALGVQVRRNTETEPTRLIRVWVVSAVTPLEKGLLWTQHSSSDLWHNYFYLRGVRQENRELKAQIEQLRLQQVRLSEDAEQAHRLQSLLAFKEQYISHTVAAQVIGSSGSEQSRSVYIDKGAREGIKTDMAVITADGVVGKVLRVFGSQPVEPSVSQVLLISDQTSGVGAILDKSRAQGYVRGSASGEVLLENIMTDETVQPGDVVLTSGGDRIFPKGLALGTVTKVSRGPEIFWNIRIRPSADLSRLEEVLVITEEQEREPDVADGSHVRAADILAARLPSIPDAQATNTPPPPASGMKIGPANAAETKPAVVSDTAKDLTNIPGRASSGELKPKQPEVQAAGPALGAPSGGTAAQQKSTVPKPISALNPEKQAANTQADTPNSTKPNLQTQVAKKTKTQAAPPPATSENNPQ